MPFGRGELIEVTITMQTAFLYEASPVIEAKSMPKNKQGKKPSLPEQIGVFAISWSRNQES